MTNFYGYGALRSPLWLVGKEEGLGVSGPGIRTHLSTWDRIGRPMVADLAGLQRSKGEGRYFGDDAINHPMWRKLARIAVAAEEGRTPRNDEVLAYQARRLGRHGGEVALLELLPLPSPQATDDETGWPYPRLTDLPELQSRRKYRDSCVLLRAGQLRTWLEEYEPRGVVFYSTDPWYLDQWNRIAGVQLASQRLAGRPVRRAERRATTFIAIANPAAPGITNEFLDAVGMEIAR